MSRALLIGLALLAACGEKEPVDSGETGEADADGDGYAASVDCDDGDASVHPEAAEVCDGVDNNCDGATDEGVLQTVYADGDGDGYGLASAANEVCALGAGQSLQAGDCNDEEPLIHPGADEVCDGLDNDCDGLVDDESAADLAWYFPDADGDGYGDGEAGELACPGALSGYVLDGSDCDDSEASVNPGAEELCDALDTDCDGVVAEALVPTDYASLQGAFDAGELDICLEAGTYREQVILHTVRDLVVRGVGSDRVVLSGSGRGRVMDVTGSSGSLTLSGLTITEGWSDRDYASGLYYDGDGTGSVTIEDVLFTDNTCEGYRCYGAAAYIGDYDSAELVDVELSGNRLYGDPNGDLSLRSGERTVLDGVSIHSSVTSVSGAGGGLASVLYVQGLSQGGSELELDDVLIDGNSASVGGSLYAPLTLYNLDLVDMSNSSVLSNDTQAGSDCVTSSAFFYGVEELNLSNVVIAGNSCLASAGGYTAGPWHFGTGSGSTATFDNVIIAGNSLTAGDYLYGAWGVGYQSDMSLNNCSVHGNVGHAPAVSAGWLLLDDATLTLYNTDVSGNEIGDDRYPSEGSGFAGESNTAFSARYSNLTDLGDTPFADRYGDPLSQEGNLSTAPRYVDVQAREPAYWDLHLTSSSSLIDAGDPNLQDPDGSRSDIGAFGGPGAGSW